MPLDLNKEHAKQLLRDFDFQSLFLDDLGWDSASGTLAISLNGHNFNLAAVAEKRGVVCYTCSLDSGMMTGHTTLLRQIERQVEKSVHEHVLIFTDKKTTQIWQWTRREPDRPIVFREYRYSVGESPELLFQKLRHLVFTLDEEDNITHVDVLKRFQEAGIYADQVTRSFYDRYKKEHEDFMGFIEGIPTEDLARWYTSVMLNRLIFIYFIQEKDFLDANRNYLQDKLAESQQRGGDRYYQDFLCPLFFEGFAKPEAERSPDTAKLLGRIPYLNGGIFEKHEIERSHGKSIRIEDKAFEKIFAFFKEYRWHLDERPLRNANEINPDVLGYIFEKYTNQKQMGAYYTKEDITDYIARNTIIPRLFDKVRQQYDIPFKGNLSFWKLLSDDPDRYIYAEVKYGIDKPLPKNISTGLKDRSKRNGWNTIASEEFGLPAETWREVIARRKRYSDVRKKLVSGGATTINDLISMNLNIRLFAQDVISQCDDPKLLAAFWQAISCITILDPTCGSGAFLFAALNILHPLYATCLDRMQVFLNERCESGARDHPKQYKLFSNILKNIVEHPNEDYFMFKSIIINNLFGVDIMEEATEICKLRLFLKLVAKVESDVGKDNLGLEPLPDIDFNVRVGNSLVGFASRAHAKQQIVREQTGQGKLQFTDTLQIIEDKCQVLENVLAEWRRLQEDGKNTAQQKQDYRNGLDELKKELDRYLAAEYGVATNNKMTLTKWYKIHQPFHWFIEFYGIMQNGGFDVVIGNPPYVEYSKVRFDYTVLKDQYLTFDTGNLYAFVVERSLAISQNPKSFGMILPLSSFCTQRMRGLIDIVKHCQGSKWFAHFGWRPATLFNGVNIPLSIVLVNNGQDDCLFTTTFNKWYSEYREALFPNIQYVSATEFLCIPFVIPKVGNEIERAILHKVIADKKLVSNYQLDDKTNAILLYYRNTGGLYWRIITDFQPLFELNGKRLSSSTESTVPIRDSSTLSCITAVLNSNLFWLYYVIFSSFHHVNPIDILSFPIDLDRMDAKMKTSLIKANQILMKDLKENSRVRLREHKGGNGSRAQTFYPSRSKPYVDDIDRILASHYNFTPDQLDYILNYDIKYRMSSTAEEEE